MDRSRGYKQLDDVSHWSIPDPTARQPIVKTWAQGAWERFPWRSALALLGTLLAVGGSAAVLIYSAGKPIVDWTFQPAVYLAVITTVINMLLVYMLREGAKVFWWTRALQPGTTLGDLHRRWNHGSSFLGALKAGKHTSFITVATIAISLAPLNGPVLQRASRVGSKTIVSTTSVQLDAAPELPYGFTGLLSGRAYAPTLLSSNFTPIYQNFTKSTPIHISQTGCRGHCVAANNSVLNAVGFSVQCSSNTVSFDLGAGLNDSMYDGTQVFYSDVSWASGQPGRLNISVQFKDQEPCTGNLQIRNCTLDYANVGYPVVIDGNSSSVSLDPSTSIFDDKINEMIEPPDMVNPFSGPTTLGGLFLALHNQYGSSANNRFTGAVGYTLTTTGSTAHRFVKPETVGYASDCKIAFSDPTQEILASIRELVFRSAISAANGTNIQSLRFTDTGHMAVFESHYEYFAGGTAITIIAILLLLPAFAFYWRLGRKVSMSPLETGKALGALLLRDVNSNSTVSKIIDQVGRGRVSYGVTRNHHLEILAAGHVKKPVDGERVY